MFNNEIMMESMMKQIFEHVQIIQQENIVFDDGLVTEAPPSVLCGKLQGGNTQNTEDRQEERSDLRDWWTNCMLLRCYRCILVHITASLKTGICTVCRFTSIQSYFASLHHVSSLQSTVSFPTFGAIVPFLLMCVFFQIRQWWCDFCWLVLIKHQELCQDLLHSRHHELVNLNNLLHWDAWNVTKLVEWIQTPWKTKKQAVPGVPRALATSPLGSGWRSSWAFAVTCPHFWRRAPSGSWWLMGLVYVCFHKRTSTTTWRRGINGRRISIDVYPAPSIFKHTYYLDLDFLRI